MCHDAHLQVHFWWGASRPSLWCRWRWGVYLINPIKKLDEGLIAIVETLRCWFKVFFNRTSANVMLTLLSIGPL